jgi:hypothetical protein
MPMDSRGQGDSKKVDIDCPTLALTRTGKMDTSNPIAPILSCGFGGAWGAVIVVCTAHIRDITNGILVRDIAITAEGVGKLLRRAEC